MIQFMEKGRLVTVWPSLKEDRPVVYLNTFEDEGERV